MKESVFLCGLPSLQRSTRDMVRVIPASSKNGAAVTLSANSCRREELARDALTKVEIYRHNYGTHTVRSILSRRGRERDAADVPAEPPFPPLTVPVRVAGPAAF